MLTISHILFTKIICKVGPPHFTEEEVGGTKRFSHVCKAAQLVRSKAETEPRQPKSTALLHKPVIGRMIVVNTFVNKKEISTMLHKL